MSESPRSASAADAGAHRLQPAGHQRQAEPDPDNGADPSTAPDPPAVTVSYLPAGLYRISCYAHVTQAATVSSSLTVTLWWTEGGASKSYSGAAITGSTTTTTQSLSVLVRMDASALQLCNPSYLYTTTYGSVGATVMKYSLDVTLELIKAGA